MPRIEYESKRFNSEHLAVIAASNKIIGQYAEQGFNLTLRQLYYQFVARDLLPNTQQEYKRLGTIISKARRAGLIDWDAIVDRTRFVRSSPSWESPASIVEACADQFNLDMWENQETRVEVWIEKDALIGVIEATCTELDVPYFSCRGYGSDSELWRAGRRMRRHRQNGQTPWVIHLGDHDPSGMDMTRDIDDRLALFSGGHIDVRRIALNMDQVEQYNPPPNPAKLTDARAKKYVRQHGYESWELDALDPSTMAQLIRDEVEAVRDPLRWKEMVKLRSEGREQLRKISDNWEDAVEAVE